MKSQIDRVNNIGLKNFLIEKKLIDGAIVSKAEAPFSREAMFTNSRDALLQASGAKLEISPQLDEIQKIGIQHIVPRLCEFLNVPVCSFNW